MDRHLLEALLESFKDDVADRVVARLQQSYSEDAYEPPPPARLPLRPLGKAHPRPTPAAAEPPRSVQTPPTLPPPVAAGEEEEESEYLTTEEAAALLKVSPKGLEGMRCKGRGPKFVKIGGRVRYRRSDLV